MSEPRPIELPPETRSALSSLRRRIRRYVVLEGLAWLAIVGGGAFWLSVAADWLFELPRSVRAGVLSGTAVVVAGGLLGWVLLRAIRTLHSRPLALILERRFPELNDRLITAVELSSRSDSLPNLTRLMLDRVVIETGPLLQKLDLREVFNHRPLHRAVLTVLLLSIPAGVLAATEAGWMRLWFRRNVLLADEFYPRETELRVRVMAEPGPRVLDFQECVYKHPRGVNLMLLAEVAPGGKVPEQVMVLATPAPSGRDYMTRVGQRQFKYTFAGVRDSFTFRLKGGDFVTRTPLRVEVVDGPRIDQIVLAARFPAYTDRNQLDETTGQILPTLLPVHGAQVSLPAGTEFQLTAESNKPLQSVRLQTETLQILATRAKAMLRWKSGEGAWQEAPLSSATPYLSANGERFSIPLRLSPEAFSVSPLNPGEPNRGLWLPAHSPLRIVLHDTDDIIAPEPARLTISAIPDEPPRVDVQPKGVGASITRQATIPVIGQIIDDYGVAQARFEYRIDGDDAFVPREFSAKTPRQLELTVDERFEVLPLDLKIGQKLTLVISALDADDLTGPHRATGEKFSFQIVAEEELLAQIAARELNLRRRFEQILNEIKEIRKDLVSQRERATMLARLRKTAAPLEAAEREQLAGLELGALTSADRSLAILQKDQNESQSLELAFRDLRDELENNAVKDVQKLLERLNQGILIPLHSVNTTYYNEFYNAVVLWKQALERKEEATASLQAALEQNQVLIDRLEAILAQMLKLENFNDAIQLLREIIQLETDLQNRTKQQRVKELK